MKILENNGKNVDFADLDSGDCFRWNDNLYVKSQCGQEAVCLVDGYAVEEMCGIQVTPVNAEIQIID